MWITIYHGVKIILKLCVAEDYRIEEIPVPTPGPGEVLCKVPFAGKPQKKFLH